MKKKINIGGCGNRSIWYNDNLIVGQGKSRGGVAFYRNKSDFVISDEIFCFNHVQMDGGCIYLLDCHNVMIKGNLFAFNKAKWGGAIYLERCSDIIISENCFLFNIAIRDGGAISLSKCDEIYIRNNCFAFNKAFRSGDIIDKHNCGSITVK